MSWHTTGTQIMQLPSKTSNRFGSKRERRGVKIEAPPSNPNDALCQNIKALRTQAAGGDYQSQIRLEAIYNLADPYLYFYDSDIRRVLNKGNSPQVERGLTLFRLMSKIRILCEPVGNTVGKTCRVRLINFEKLTVNELFEIKGQSIGLVPRAALLHREGGKFNGLDLLSKEEKILYRRVKKYFGKRKKPTLQRIALDILGEEDELFSERNSFNYLAAARDFHLKYKQESGSSLYYIESVDSFNLNAKTGQEMLVDLVRRAYRDIELPVIHMGQHLVDLYARVAQPLTESLLKISATYQSKLLRF